MDRGTAAGLLDAHCDVNAQDSQGRTALLYAAAAGKAGLVSLLAEGKADLQCCSQGVSAMHVAAACGHPCVIEALLKAGAHVGSVDKHGLSAGDLASMAMNQDVAQSLSMLQHTYGQDGSGSAAKRNECAEAVRGGGLGCGQGGAAGD